MIVEKKSREIMNWINAEITPPTKLDSPILASGEFNEGFFNIAALHWLDEEEGLDVEGWYDHSDEYGMKDKDIKYWMPLPKPPDN